MSILVRFTPDTLKAADYDETVRRLEETGDIPADGLEYHCCFGSDGSLKVSEVWDSQDKFEAFGEKLMPVLENVGIDPGQPEIIEVHNTIKG